MEAEEKEKQIIEAGETSSELKNDLDVLLPEPIEVVIGERQYKLKPLSLKNLRLLSRLSEINISKGNPNEKDIDVMIDCIASILRENDKEFLEDNIDIPMMYDIFGKINRLNTAGMPQTGGTPKGK